MKLMKPYYDAVEYLVTGGYASTVTKDEAYSDSYSWITIYGINETGKKRKLYDIETA